MTSTYSHLGEAIRARREVLGLTQEELCERLGWAASRKTELSAIENGRGADLKFSRICAFAAALSLPVSEFVIYLTTNMGDA